MRVLLLAIPTLCACGDAVTDTGPTGAAELQLSTAILDFGLVDVGQTASLDLDLENTGDGVLQLGSYTASGLAFQVTEPATVLLAPGETTTLTVEHEPAEPEPAQSTLVIETDNAGTHEVALSAEGRGPWLQLTPVEMVFDGIEAGCEQTRAIVLHNTGNADLVVDEVLSASSSDDLRIEPWDGEEWVLSPDEQRSIVVSYSPADAIDDLATVEVRSNDPRGARIAEQRSLAAAVTTQAVQVAALPEQVDVLFVVDDSPSMAAHDKVLAADGPALMAALDAQGLSWRLSVATLSDAVLQGPFIEPDTKDADAPWANSMHQGSGDANDGLAALIEVLRGKAWDDRARKGARLSAVVVADEDDDSKGKAASYVGDARHLIDEPSYLRIDAIGSSTLDCAQQTPRYEAAAELADGALYSICDPSQEASFQSIAAGLGAQVDTVTLDGDPIERSIEVAVGGVPTASWSYDPGPRTVLLDNAPGWDQAIEVTWVDSACP